MASAQKSKTQTSRAQKSRVWCRFYKLYSILQIITDWKNIPGIDFSKLADVDWSKIPDVDVSKILGNVDWSKISVTKISAQN